MAARQPDYNVTAMRADDNTVKGRIGAAWKNDDGSISIRLDPFISLSYADKAMIRLWPVEGIPKKSFGSRRLANATDPDNDEPF